MMDNGSKTDYLKKHPGVGRNLLFGGYGSMKAQQLAMAEHAREKSMRIEDKPGCSWLSTPVPEKVRAVKIIEGLYKNGVITKVEAESLPFNISAITEFVENKLDGAAVVATPEWAEKLEELKDIDEAVNHPSHYNAGKYEVIDVIEDWQLGFNLGNTVKYLARAKHKGKEKEDLEKALWYLEREIEELERRKCE